ncbi:MAG: hypothetical protein AAF511_12165, partial [Pseudomonadota bacterium]
MGSALPSPLQIRTGTNPSIMEVIVRHRGKLPVKPALRGPVIEPESKRRADHVSTGRQQWEDFSDRFRGQCPGV